MQNNPYVNITDNVNISESNDFVAFFKVVTILIAVIVGSFFILNFIGNIIVLNLPYDKQVKLEKFLSPSVEKQYEKDLLKDSDKSLDKIQQLSKTLMNTDKELQTKGHFQYHIIKADEVNAYVTADGNIYFTDKLLKEINDDEQLTFILAHEMGHYMHKDHLKNFSRGISGIIVCFFIAGLSGDKNISDFVENTINFTNIQHSQADEIAADKFANDLTMKIYNSNAKVIKFFEYIDEKQKSMSFLYFFSSHPSPQERIRLLKSY